MPIGTENINEEEKGRDEISEGETRRELSDVQRPEFAGTTAGKRGKFLGYREDVGHDSGKDSERSQQERYSLLGDSPGEMRTWQIR